MELTPKQFQLDALDKLRGFLGDARLTGDPAGAFTKWTAEPGRSLFARYRPLSALPEVPSVCLRLPTGGGKTILGAMAVGVVAESYLERAFPLVLWLVPSDTIRAQTLRALRDADHPYRRALGAPFGGAVRVFDMADFANMRPQDLRANVCVVVGTMQTLRVTNTDGRRVYAHNENLEGHFGPAALKTPGLELIEAGLAGAGTAKFSFANLLKVQRPVVIVDEAHRFMTELSDRVLGRIGPSVVLDLTATPDAQSNVLYRATAAQLKADDMIKLPVVLTEHTTGWQDCLGEAVKTRKKLAALAGEEPEYVRPVLLVQARNVGQEGDWRAVRQHLLETERLEAREIAVHTGDTRELDGIDLLARDCPITTIVTVQALKEGWDCPFAYVLCSVANTGAAQDVEQLLGRVLRMPYARRRWTPELNKAYAHVTSERFGEAARLLKDALVDLGFDGPEADEAVEQPGKLPLEEPAHPVFAIELPARPDLSAVPMRERAAVVVEETAAGPFALRAEGPISLAVAEQIVSVAPAMEQQALRQRIGEHNALWSPAERGVRFRDVPRLVIELDGQQVLWDEDSFAEAWEWDLLEHPANLSRFEFDERTRSYTLDLEGQLFTVTPLLEPGSQMELLPSEVSREGLVAWLSPRLRDISITQTVLAAWILRAVADALDKPEFSLEVLDRGRYVLLRKLREEMAAARSLEMARGYQNLLFGTTMRVVTSEEFSLRYADRYEPRNWCESYRFRKHYYARVGEMKNEGEEFDCAVELDRVDEVKHWIRNLAGPGRETSSFWLQTSTDKFYPDFVAELMDGRLLAVEYKGEAYRTNDDSQEKNALGRLWADRSGGRAVFVMVDRQRHGLGLREQLLRALGEPARGLR